METLQDKQVNQALQKFPEAAKIAKLIIEK